MGIADKRMHCHEAVFGTIESIDRIGLSRPIDIIASAQTHEECRTDRLL